MNKLVSFVIASLLLTSPPVLAASKGKILVIVSSENSLPLKNGKNFATGYYLNELAVPSKKLTEAGYELVFANPKGNPPPMDVRSDKVSYFGGDTKEYENIKTFHKNLKQLKRPLKLSQVIKDGLDQYQAVFFPGGHAPMTDLMASREVGIILRDFHSKQKPTALICHGPVALAAATQDPAAFQKALSVSSNDDPRPLTAGWIYAGYKMTVFSTAEEKIAEKELGGATLFYPEDVLKIAGGKVEVAKEWQPNAIRDRELITGQNPFSDGKFVELLIAAINEKKLN